MKEIPSLRGGRVKARSRAADEVTDKRPKRKAAERKRNKGNKGKLEWSIDAQWAT